jgi:hypothetical protein
LEEKICKDCVNWTQSGHYAGWGECKRSLRYAMAYNDFCSYWKSGESDNHVGGGINPSDLYYSTFEQLVVRIDNLDRRFNNLMNLLSVANQKIEDLEGHVETLGFKVSSVVEELMRITYANKVGSITPGLKNLGLM